jgi:hypothetical protein
MYAVLSRSRCRLEVMLYARDHVSNYDYILQRMLLEHTFNDTSKVKLKETYARWYDIDIPLFFYVGVKSLKQSRKLFDKEPTTFDETVMLLQSVMIQPLKYYHKYAQEIPELVTNELYVLTLYLLGMLGRKYIPNITFDCAPPRIVAKASLKAFEHCRTHEFVENYSMLAHRSENPDVSRVSELGLNFFKLIYTCYVPEYFGDVLKHMILTDQALCDYSILNFNINSKLSRKNGLSNYIIPDDKLNISCVEPLKHIQRNWMSEYKFQHRKWLGRTQLCIIKSSDYIRRTTTCSVISLPNMRKPVADNINMKRLNDALSVTRSKNTVEDIKYEYLGINLRTLTQNVYEIVYMTKLREVLGLDTLEISLGTYFNNLYIIYSLPKNDTIYTVNEYDIFHLQESNSELTLKILSNYAFMYIVGADPKVTPLYRTSGVYVEGCLCNLRHCVRPIISESNRMLYKSVLTKYSQKLTKIFNEWIVKLTLCDLNTAFIVAIHERLLDLFDVRTWVGDI